jgi:hypothetical protein
MFIFANLTSIFHFKFPDYEGDAKIEYGFPDLLKDLNKKDDFEYKVLEVHPWIDRNLTSKENHELKERVVKEFSSILNDNYLNYQRKYGVQLEFKL